MRIEICLFIYLFHKYLLSTYYVPSPRDITAKTKFLPHEAYLLEDKTYNKQISRYITSVKCYEEKEKPQGCYLRWNGQVRLLWDHFEQTPEHTERMSHAVFVKRASYAEAATGTKVLNPEHLWYNGLCLMHVRHLEGL